MRWISLKRSEGSTNYRFEISAQSNLGIITQPSLYDGDLYGTYENPIPRIDIYKAYSTSSGGYVIGVKYYIDDVRYIETYRAEPDFTISPTQVTVFGVPDDAVLTLSIPSKYDYESSFLSDTFISGKWRLRNEIYAVEGLVTGFLIPIYGTAYYKNGDIKPFIMGGSIDDWSWAYETRTINFRDLQNNEVKIRPEESYDETTPGTPIEECRDIIIDFGNTPQHVPYFFYNYFKTNFDIIYENQYTVYNENSLQVAQSEPEQPPIVKTNLISSVNSYQLALTRADDRVITLTWSNPNPENKVFKGLSIAPNSSEIVVPIGEREVLIEKSTNFYMVYGDYTPPPVPPDPPPLPTYEESQLPRPKERPLPEGAYNANCYTNTAEANRVDKSNYLTPVRTIHGVLREPTSVTDMVMTIQYPHYPDFNYIRIPELKRYYFVNDITIINANLYELDLSVDPLMSYKDAILGLTAFVDRNEFLSNPMIIDKKRVVMQGVNIEENEIRNGFFLQPIDEENDIRFVITGYKISAGYAPDTTP